MALLTSETTFDNCSEDDVNASLGNSSSDHRISDPSLAVAIKFVGYWELIVAVIGAPANLLVLYLTVKFLRRGARRQTSASSDRRHQSNLWFIFSMTLADYFFAGAHAPMMFAQYSLGVEYGAGVCLTLYIITHTTTICSSISLLWLNIDKFLYLNQPLHYHGRVTSRRAQGAVVCAWATSAVWALFFMLGPFTKHTSQACDYKPSHINWYTAFAVGFFVLPTAISLVISVYIGLVVSRVMRENAVRRRASSIMCNGNDHGRRSINTSASAKAIAFVFTTTMWSAVTYLPYRIAYLLYISPLYKQIATWWSQQFFYMLFALLAMNALGNPIITILTQRQYSVAFMRLIRNQSHESTYYSTTDATSVRRRRSSQHAGTTKRMSCDSQETRFSVKKHSKAKFEKLTENGQHVSKF